MYARNDGWCRPRNIAAADGLRCDVRAAHAGDATTSAIGVWSQLGVQRFGVAGLFERIWQLRDNLTAYDATYVAVAEALDAPLFTADARLARAPGSGCEIEFVQS